MSSKFWVIALGLLIPAGCTFPVQQDVDNLICQRSALNFDVQAGKDENVPKAASPQNPGELLPAGFFLADAPKVKAGSELFFKRLRVPDLIPGSEAPEIKWFDSKAPDNVKKAIIEKFFPPLENIQPDNDFPLGPNGKKMTLSDLQRIAISKNPVLRQRATDIEAARGAAIQAGAYPNPTFGFETSGAGPGGGPSVGVFAQQQIVVLGKRALAQAAAMMDLRNAEIAFRRAETDLLSNVRSGYYSVLVAQESIRANRGLVELTDELYRVMVDQAKHGEASAYEPLQPAVFSGIARTALVQARNSRLLAWRQLAATIGEPHMPPVALAGEVNGRAPRLDFEKALGYVLTHHTDVLSTAQTIEKARHLLQLAQVTPYPDVTVQAGVINDMTPPGPSRMVGSFQFSVPVPVFDTNKGAIRQSQAALLSANEEPHRVQADLTSRFAEAYRRYEENRVLLEMYQKSILPKQVQAFRTAVKRYFGGEVGAVAFNDLVSSEQNLVLVIGNYLPILQAQWQAVVDVSCLLQTNQLYEMADEINSAPVVDFEELLRMPCSHPCAPPVAAPTRESFGKMPATSIVSAPAPVQAMPVVTTVARPALLAPIQAGPISSQER